MVAEDEQDDPRNGNDGTTRSVSTRPNRSSTGPPKNRATGQNGHEQSEHDRAARVFQMQPVNARDR